MGLQLRMKRQADEITPLLKASSYRCKGAPVYDPTALTRATKSFSTKRVSRNRRAALCQHSLPSLFAVARCGSITSYSSLIGLGKSCRPNVAYTRLERGTSGDPGVPGDNRATGELIALDGARVMGEQRHPVLVQQFTAGGPDL